MLISESDYAHETLARLLSLRDAFVALFFVTIGALIDPSAVVTNLPLLGAIVGLVVLGKLVVWTLVVWLFERPFWTALRAAVGLTQIGEFSFILVQVARDAGHVGDDVYNATLAASLLTILINAVLVRVVPRWASTAQLAREARELTAGAPAAGAATDTWCCAGSGGWAAPWARPWRRSGFPTRSSRSIPTSSSICAGGAWRASSATPPTRASWRKRARHGRPSPWSRCRRSTTRAWSSAGSGPSTPGCPFSPGPITGQPTRS